MIADKRPTPFKHHFAINEQQSLEAKIQNLLKLLKNFLSGIISTTKHLEDGWL